MSESKEGARPRETLTAVSPVHSRNDRTGLSRDHRQRSRKTGDVNRK